MAACLLVAVCLSLVGPGRAVSGEPVPVVVVPDVTYAVVDGVPIRLDAYVPDDGAPLHGAVVLVHGGGWRTGDKSSMADEGRYLASHGLVAFSIDYRLAPEHVFPAALDDAKTAVRWIRRNAGDFAVDPSRVVALGSSAGGHLVSMLAMQTDGRGATGSGVLGAVAWSSPMDLELAVRRGGHQVDEAVLQFLGCADPSSCRRLMREGSPITHAGEGDADLLFVHSEDEMIPVGCARTMHRRLTEVALPHTYVELPGDLHGSAYAGTVIPGTGTTVLEASLAHLRSASG